MDIFDPRILPFIEGEESIAVGAGGGVKSLFIYLVLRSEVFIFSSYKLGFVVLMTSLHSGLPILKPELDLRRFKS